YSSGGGGGASGRMNADHRLTLVKALLARGADPNARITTSAMMMSYIGYPKKGAFEPFACGTGDLLGATPLFVAAVGADTVDRNLFARGAAPGERDLAEASRSDATTDILRTLIAAGADQKLTTVDGTTPLMVAAGLGRSTFDPSLKRGRRSV